MMNRWKLEQHKNLYFLFLNFYSKLTIALSIGIIRCLASHGVNPLEEIRIKTTKMNFTLFANECEKIRKLPKHAFLCLNEGL